MPKKEIEKKARPAKAPLLPSVRMYRRVAAAFLIVTLAMLATVLYLATVRADIKIETSQEPVSAEFFATVMTEPQANEDVPGAIFEETVEESNVFLVEGEGVEVPAKAHGPITITNTSGSEQALVATTRFLSESGVLFRLTKGVTVPANGSIQAEVAADKEGREGEIPASRFTIPGLAPVKQALIYGESAAPMVGGVVKRATVTEDMLNIAHVKLLETVKTRLDEKWRAALAPSLQGFLLRQETIEKRSDTEPGTETGTYTVATIVKNTGVYFDRERLRRIAEVQLQDHVPAGQVLSTADLDGMLVEIDQVQASSGIARLHVRVEGTAVLKATADVLDREHLVGMNVEEAEAYLESQATIKNATVELKPFWVRRIPRLQDHIY
ncbi:hypothetical protein HYV72_00450, partial [Candidatus Uhrbacteria bacterium]|nr:hypothetical protein [Candidatus Uhrbacteria bacterium]